jgi:hypothetical protein
MSQPPFPPDDPNNPNQPDSGNPWAPGYDPYANPGQGSQQKSGWDPQQNTGWPQNPPQNPWSQNPYGANYNNPFLPFGVQRPVANATAILVLGIISIPGAFCYGVIGLITGIIALALFSKAISDYNANPAMYTASSYNNAKAGRICAVIGVSISGFFLIAILLAIIVH